MSASQPIVKNSERAVSDKSGNSVILLYDGTNDLTKMARATTSGYLIVDAETPQKRGRTLINYDADDNIEYLGTHASQDAADSDDEWDIKKFIYSGGNITDIQLIVGIYANRATLGWV